MVNARGPVPFEQPRTGASVIVIASRENDTFRGTLILFGSSSIWLQASRVMVC